jgi:hypothetical protein
MAPEVEAAVGDLMAGAAEAATAAAEDGFGALGAVLGAQFEKAYSTVEAAQMKALQAIEDEDGAYTRRLEIERRKHERRMADLQEEAGRATVAQRKGINEKIAQEQENHQRRLEDLSAGHQDKLLDLEFDGLDAVRAAETKQALERGEALRDFQRGVEEVQRDTVRAAEAISKKASRAVSDAMADAADAILEARDRAEQAIADLQANQTLSRDIRGQRDVFGAGQDTASREFEAKREDADLDYRLKKDLEDAKLKLGRDRAKAETEEERRELDVRYAESVEDIRRGFDDAKKDLKRRRELDADARAFRKEQDAALQAFNDALEDAALQRQMARIHAEAVTRVTEINQALDEKIAAVRQNEREENEALRASADEKLNDLRERFYDKVGVLNEESKTAFEALFASIKKGVDDAAGSVLALAEALARVAGARTAGAAGAGAGGGAGGGGAAWTNQPQSVRDMFTATHGANAQQRWEAEHNRELAAGMGATLPEPTGYDPVTGLPTGPGYYEPLPNTPYWRENYDRFNPLPWGTEYPPEAFYGSDSTSKDVFGGNNTYSSDNRAIGGPVAGGRAYRVGETGWGETFVPATAGRLVTQDQMAMAAGGGRHGAWGGGGDTTVIVEIDRQEVARLLAPYVQGETDRLVRLRLG